MFSEKRPISNIATAGIYYFKTAELFIQSAKYQIFKKNTDISNVYYISGIFNELILLKKSILIYLIEETDFDKIDNVKNFKDAILNKSIKSQNNNLITLTKEYVKLFNMKNIEAISKIFNKDSSLIEVGINEYYGREKILSLLKNVFENNLNLEISNITPLHENNMSILEFNLSINDKKFVGNDIIFWKNDKIQHMKAYFYEEKNKKVFKLSKMVRGWFIGNFSPTVKKTKLFEVAIQNYSKGDFEPSHHHKKACEITVIAKGSAKMNNKFITKEI